MKASRPLRFARYLGRYSAPAANEPGFEVVAEIFRIDHRSSVVANAEIEEIKWVDPRLPNALPLAPLTCDFVLPLCRSLSR